MLRLPFLGVLLPAIVAGCAPSTTRGGQLPQAGSNVQLNAIPSPPFSPIQKAILSADENAVLNAYLAALPWCDEARRKGETSKLKRILPTMGGVQEPVVEIEPLCEARSITEKQLSDPKGMYVAKLHATDKYDNLRLASGTNYLWVQLQPNGRTLRAIVRQLSGHQEDIQPMFFQDDPSHGGNVWGKWRTTVMSAGLTTDFEGSRPWVACTATGCCCGLPGGQACH